MEFCRDRMGASELGVKGAARSTGASSLTVGRLIAIAEVGCGSTDIEGSFCSSTSIISGPSMTLVRRYLRSGPSVLEPFLAFAGHFCSPLETYS